MYYYYYTCDYMCINMYVKQGNMRVGRYAGR